MMFPAITQDSGSAAVLRHETKTETDLDATLRRLPRDVAEPHFTITSTNYLRRVRWQP